MLEFVDFICSSKLFDWQTYRCSSTMALSTRYFVPLSYINQNIQWSYPPLINSHHQDDYIFLVGRGMWGPVHLPPSHPLGGNGISLLNRYGFRTEMCIRNAKNCFKKPNQATEIESFAWNLPKNWHQRIKRQLMFFFCIPTLHWRSVLQFDVYFWNNQDRMAKKIEKK